MRLYIGLCLLIFMEIRVNGFVGITWGRQQSQQLVPSMVVDLLLQNRIPALRLLTSGSDISQVFAETNISLTVTLLNNFMNKANRKDKAYTFVNDRIKEPTNKGVKIVELSVGSEPFSNTVFKAYKTDQVVTVLKFIREALDDMNLGYVKTTTGHGMDVLKVSKVPSEAEFRDDIKDQMLESLKIFNQSGSPFVVYMFPIRYVTHVLKYPIEFAFFDNKSGYKVKDGNVTYTNAVELMIDTVAWAVTKAGYPNMRIEIGQIGWPTDGYPQCNIENAHRFYKGLLKFLGSRKGTHLRPGDQIDVFLHSLSDENKFNETYGAFQRHWGIYKADGSPKYKIDFSLQDLDIYPTQAKGIVTMPSRWCIFNGDKSDMDLVKRHMDFACSKADCTRLAEGGSCDGLTIESKVSYIFNAYFQKMKQQVDECDFDGLGEIVSENPSVGNCDFPIEILSLRDTNPIGMKLRV